MLWVHGCVYCCCIAGWRPSCCCRCWLGSTWYVGKVLLLSVLLYSDALAQQQQSDVSNNDRRAVTYLHTGRRAKKQFVHTNQPTRAHFRDIQLTMYLPPAEATATLDVIHERNTCWPEVPPALSTPLLQAVLLVAVGLSASRRRCRHS